MKIGIYADAHFSLNSSIILGQTNSLEGRLRHLIDSFKWMYELFNEQEVEAIFDLGDLADSYILRAEEITAISEALSYNTSIPETHILGNHERLDEAGSINSVSFVNNIDNHRVLNRVELVELGVSTFTLLPYNNYDEKQVEELEDTDYLLSHIDIRGSDTGGWSLREGINPRILADKFGLTINGHIHNGSWVIPDKVMNIGAISGQNFSSKQISWGPSVMILDTEDKSYNLYENPYALNFINKNISSLDQLVEVVNQVKKGTYALQVRVPANLVEDARKVIESNNKIVAMRVMTKADTSGLGKMSYEDINRVNSIEGGFEQLVKFIENQDSLPYNEEDIKKVILELEDNKLV